MPYIPGLLIAAELTVPTFAVIFCPTTKAAALDGELLAARAPTEEEDDDDDDETADEEEDDGDDETTEARMHETCTPLRLSPSSNTRSNDPSAFTFAIEPG